MALYMALAYVVMHYIPQADLTADADTAVAIVADKLLGKWGYGLIYFGAVMAFVSGINATFFSIFRISRSFWLSRAFCRSFTVNCFGAAELTGIC